MKGSLSLYIHPPLKPEWQIPTVSPECLAVDAYARLFQIPITRIPTNNVHISPTKSLPMLVVNGENGIGSMGEIFTKLREIGYAPPHEEQLSEAERCDIVAYTALLEEKLYYCQMYEWWMTENLETFTLRAFEMEYSFPLSLWMRLQDKAKHFSFLKTIGYDSKEKVEAIAKEIINVLSIKLGDNEYFFGDSPTTFDCIAFGFLQTLGFKELRQSWLGDLVQGKKNLVSFCNNFIGNSYFPLKGERKMDQMLKLKPLQDFCEKETTQSEEKTLVTEMERRSIINIVGAGVILFVYLVVQQESKAQ